MNIVLTGMRGTGKTTIGQALAARLGYTFIDTDAEIERIAGCRIAAVVAAHGWDHFRCLERQIVTDIAENQNAVIATGGGTLIDENNARRLKANGIVVLLLCDVPVLQRRIAAETNRPPLTGQSSAIDELDQVWQTRRLRYHAVADILYDVSAEGVDSDQDIQNKAAGIHTLLRRTTWQM